MSDSKPFAWPAGLDPRQVPVQGVDAHLPAVPAAQLTPAALRRRFAHPPRWQPELRREPPISRRQPAAAAVLVALVERPQGVTVLLTERAGHLSAHSGQVAFAGGRVDAGDTDAAHTALREAQEEIGLPPAFVQVLGCLPVYVTGTQFIVTPVAALVRPGFVLQPNPDEVSSVFEVPLAFLMSPAHHRRHRLESGGQARQWFSMPYAVPAADPPDATKNAHLHAERFIWGATAGMLRNLYRFLIAPLESAAGTASGMPDRGDRSI